MENSCFPCLRRDFPAGLRVLVVDCEPTYLKILEHKLNKCQYQVTTCSSATSALHLLREKKDGYDIVISDVNLPDMDGFKLLEHVRLEMDLPVIMMSVDGEKSTVTECFLLGACDYLIKPIPAKQLQTIWQHVTKSRKQEGRSESFESNCMIRNGSELSHSGSLGDMTSTKKRKHANNKECFHPSSSKRARLVWSEDLHHKFLDAVNHTGLDQARPKKILNLMKVPGLTREHVASHLQKYRTRLQNENKQENQQFSYSTPETEEEATTSSTCDRGNEFHPCHRGVRLLQDEKENEATNLPFPEEEDLLCSLLQDGKENEATNIPFSEEDDLFCFPLQDVKENEATDLPFSEEDDLFRFLLQDNLSFDLHDLGIPEY